MVMLETVKKYLRTGWLEADETWTYASAGSFTIAGDKTGKYQIGDKIKLTQTSVKYFRITAISYSAPNTTVTVDGFGIATVANATISANYHSKMETPQGFPQKEVSLFSGTPGTSITISETSANFDRLLVVYEGNNDGGVDGTPYYTAILDVAIGKVRVSPTDMGYIDSAYRIRTTSAVITCSTTTVAISTGGSNYSTDSTAGSTSVLFSDAQTTMKITKVIGIRW